MNSVTVSKDITKLYSKEFGLSNNNDNSMNQMLILKQLSTINPYTKKVEPYLSGSSIKGALQSVLELSEEESQKLKVSDAIGVDVKNHIAWSIRKTSKGNISQKLEVISKSSTFELFLTKQNRLSLETIKEKLHNFYRSADSGLFLNYSRDLKATEGLLRVGRYCGKDFLVQELSEKDKPKTKSLFKMSEKGTRVDEIPFGWIKWEWIEESKPKETEALIEEELSLEKLIESLVKNNPNPNESEDIVLFNAIKRGEFDNFRIEALEILKDKMKTLGKWVEVSKKPKQDKKYKRTLEVIQMISELK